MTHENCSQEASNRAAQKRRRLESNNYYFSCLPGAEPLQNRLPQLRNQSSKDPPHISPEESCRGKKAKLLTEQEIAVTPL